MTTRFRESSKDKRRKTLMPSSSKNLDMEKQEILLVKAKSKDRWNTEHNLFLQT